VPLKFIADNFISAYYKQKNQVHISSEAGKENIPCGGTEAV
jgi:hypothetical protein